MNSNWFHQWTVCVWVDYGLVLQVTNHWFQQANMGSGQILIGFHFNWLLWKHALDEDNQTGVCQKRGLNISQLLRINWRSTTDRHQTSLDVFSLNLDFNGKMVDCLPRWTHRNERASIMVRNIWLAIDDEILAGQFHRFTDPDPSGQDLKFWNILPVGSQRERDHYCELQPIPDAPCMEYLPTFGPFWG